MKRIYSALFFLVTGLALHSQSNFDLKYKANNALVSDNATYNFKTTSWSSLEHGFFLHNKSASTVTISVRKYEDLLNEVASSDKAEAYFCTGATCYQPSVMSGDVELAPGEGLDFKAYFTEASVAGQSEVRYTFSDQSNSDQLNINFKYSADKEAGVAKYGETPSISVYPNPCQSEAFIVLPASGESTAKVSLYNQMGVCVMNYSQDIEAGSNSVRIGTDGLPAGFYNLSVERDGQKLNGRLLIVQ